MPSNQGQVLLLKFEKNTHLLANWTRDLALVPPLLALDILAGNSSGALRSHSQLVCLYHVM